MRKIIFFLFILLIVFCNNAFTKQRYFLLDRNITNIKLEIDNNFNKSNNISEVLTNIVKERLKKNNIEIFENSQIKLIIKILDLKSEEKMIVLSEFGEYDIVDNEVIASIKIEIYDKENNIIWNRKLSKLNSQKWIDFSRLRIGSNIVLQGFYVPTQFVIDLKRKYSQEEFVNLTLIELVNSVLDNLIY